MTTLLTALLALATTQEQIDNPQYQHWKSCKPGSWVKHKMVMSAGDQIIETETVATLIEVTAEKAVTETKTTTTLAGRKMEMPARTQDVPAKMEKKEGQGALTETDEDVAVNGKTYKCRAFGWETVQGGQSMKGKGWLCGDVPGGIVKSEFNSPKIPKPVEMLLVEFEKK